MYRPKCGLIVGCFRGYIELLDFKVVGGKTTLETVGSWENETKHRDLEADKAIALKKRRQKGPIMVGDDDYNTDDKDMTEAELQNELTLQEYFQPRKATSKNFRGASMGPNTTRNSNYGPS
jgi:hypothetical protein